MVKMVNGSAYGSKGGDLESDGVIDANKEDARPTKKREADMWSAGGYSTTLHKGNLSAASAKNARMQERCMCWIMAPHAVEISADPF